MAERIKSSAELVRDPLWPGSQQDLQLVVDRVGQDTVIISRFIDIRYHALYDFVQVRVQGCTVVSWLQDILKVSLSPEAKGDPQMQRWSPGRDSFCQEPIFVPRPQSSAEDDGWILAPVFRSATSTTDLVILDAQNLSQGPIATIHLPHHIPIGAKSQQRAGCAFAVAWICITVIYPHTCPAGHLHLVVLWPKVSCRLPMLPCLCLDRKTLHCRMPGAL